MVTDNDAAPGNSPQGPRNDDAVFTGWQKTGSSVNWQPYVASAQWSLAAPLSCLAERNFGPA